MERLTYRGLERMTEDGLTTPSYSDYPTRRIIEKLAEYEDLEEQGLLLKLPCPIGTEVWTIMCGMTGKHPTLFKQSFEYSMIEHFGKAVFLTKDEAQNKIEEMSK